MLRYRWFIAFAVVPLILLIFFIQGCGTAKPATDSSVTQQTTTPTTTSTPSSQGNLPPPPPPTAPIFPHSKEWASPTVHGVWVVQNNMDICLNCHKTTSTQTETPPACSSCHAVFPHAQNWKQKENHGTWVLANGNENCATQCHGTDLSGGLSKTSCNSCHSVYPHKSDWEDYNGHGSYVLNTLSGDKTVCQNCHGTDLKGGDTGVSCYSCHSVYPHTSNWKDPTQHGFAAHGTGKQTCATGTCHGSDFKGNPPNVPSCYSCHASFPHSDSWGTSTGHPQYVVTTLNNDKTSCQLCHGNDFAGGTTGTSCSSCHANYPHDSNWGPPTNNHGAQAYGSGKNNCTACHGADFKGITGNPAPSCYSCHADFPHTDPNWQTGDVGRTANTHATQFISESLANSPITCQGCHGTNYDRAVGVAPQITCTGCHANLAGHTNDVTHQSSASVPWQDPTQHGKFYSSHFNATSPTAYCKDCHGAFTGFNSTQTKATLKTQSDCYSCHWAYPHTAGDDPSDALGVWEPVVGKDSNNNACGAIVNFGHIIYLMGNPLFTDQNGVHPASTSDSINIDAIKNTCGGASGSCHADGLRSFNTGSTSALCGQYCHTATMPSIPSRPPCP